MSPNPTYPLPVSPSSILSHLRKRFGEKQYNLWIRQVGKDKLIEYFLAGYFNSPQFRAPQNSKKNLIRLPSPIADNEGYPLPSPVENAYNSDSEHLFSSPTYPEGQTPDQIGPELEELANNPSAEEQTKLENYNIYLDNNSNFLSGDVNINSREELWKLIRAIRRKYRRSDQSKQDSILLLNACQKYFGDYYFACLESRLGEEGIIQLVLDYSSAQDPMDLYKYVENMIFQWNQEDGKTQDEAHKLVVAERSKHEENKAITLLIKGATELQRQEELCIERSKILSQIYEYLGSQYHYWIGMKGSDGLIDYYLSGNFAGAPHPLDGKFHRGNLSCEDLWNRILECVRIKNHVSPFGFVRMDSYSQDTIILSHCKKLFGWEKYTYLYRKLGDNGIIRLVLEYSEIDFLNPLQKHVDALVHNWREEDKVAAEKAEKMAVLKRHQAEEEARLEHLRAQERKVELKRQQDILTIKSRRIGAIEGFSIGIVFYLLAWLMMQEWNVPYWHSLASLFNGMIPILIGAAILAWKQRKNFRKINFQLPIIIYGVLSLIGGVMGVEYWREDGQLSGNNIFVDYIRSYLSLDMFLQPLGLCLLIFLFFWLERRFKILSKFNISSVILGYAQDDFGLLILIPILSFIGYEALVVFNAIQLTPWFFGSPQGIAFLTNQYPLIIVMCVTTFVGFGLATLLPYNIRK